MPGSSLKAAVRLPIPDHTNPMYASFNDMLLKVKRRCKRGASSTEKTLPKGRAFRSGSIGRGWASVLLRRSGQLGFGFGDYAKGFGVGFFAFAGLLPLFQAAVELLLGAGNINLLGLESVGG